MSGINRLAEIDNMVTRVGRLMAPKTDDASPNTSPFRTVGSPSSILGQTHSFEEANMKDLGSDPKAKSQSTSDGMTLFANRDLSARPPWLERNCADDACSANVAEFDHFIAKVMRFYVRKTALAMTKSGGISER